MESPMAEQELQYWRQLDENTIAFYFNVEQAASDGQGVMHDAGAEIKLSDWVKGLPNETEILALQEEYIKMSDNRTLMIGNCRAKIMIPEIYELEYGFLDTGEANEITSDEWHEGEIREAGPISTRANLKRE
jgi:hypothetical protein